MEKDIKDIDWTHSFSMFFDQGTGLSDKSKTTKRRLSNMKGIFSDEKAYQEILMKEDPLLYEFYELGAPENAGDLAFGTSITYPGKIGNEFYMTKGHFHQIIDTAEVYFCFKGKGYMLLENSEGDWKAEKLSLGSALYVPKGYAHRTVNTGNEPLITFFVFRADAGHDYGTIETKGYRKQIVEKNGEAVIIDSAKWK